MSRQRRYTTPDTRRLRKDTPLLQASESEILSDLKRLKYVKKVEKVPVEVVSEIELPKKRKKSEEEDPSVIDGLIKLMSAKASEVKKQQVETIEKKNEPMQKSPMTNQAWATAYAFHAHLMKSMMLMSQFGYIPSPGPANVGSTANVHIKAAQYIHSYKIKAKNASPSKLC